MFELDLTSTLAPIGWAMISLFVFSAVGIWRSHTATVVNAAKDEELPADRRRSNDEEHDESLPQAA